MGLGTTLDWQVGHRSDLAHLDEPLRLSVVAVNALIVGQHLLKPCHSRWRCRFRSWQRTRPGLRLLVDGWVFVPNCFEQIHAGSTHYASICKHAVSVQAILYS